MTTDSMTPATEAKLLINTAATDDSNRPRVHPNGFIQLDLGKDMRLHVWPHDERVSGQRVRTSIHDHIFSMRSHVLIGQMVNKEFRFEPAETGDHQIYRAVYRAAADSVLEPTGIYGMVALHSEQPVHVGEYYSFAAFEFHDTVTHGFTATLMKKERVFHGLQPRALCPRGQDPDNDFRRGDVTEAVLWEHIERVMESL